MRLHQRITRRLRRTYFSRVGYFSTSICDTRFKVAPDRFEFWDEVATGRWEPQLYEALKRWLTPDSVYFDVGAWIGPTVLYAATRCKKVVCFEPDPVAHCALRRNIDLNHLQNVQVFGVALADSLGVNRMSSFGTELGDSQASLLNPSPSHEATDVVTVPWHVFIDSPGMASPDVIKIDIEGGEFRLLPSMQEYLARHLPVLCLSTHAPFLADGARRHAMLAIRNALSHYDTVLDENLAATNSNALLEHRSLHEFRSFVFMRSSQR